MEIFSQVQSWQYIAWFLALINLIIGLYILVLNPRHTANRHTTLLMLLFAAQSLSAGILMGLHSPQDTALPGAVLGVTAIIAQPTILLTIVVILRPGWLRGWPGILTRLLYLMIVVPLVLTLIDLWQRGALFFSGLPAGYQGGLLVAASYTQGSLAPILRIVNLYIPALLLVPFLIYIAGFAKEEPRPRRTLAFLLLAAHITTLALMAAGVALGRWELPLILVNSAYLIVLTYASFQNLVSPRAEQSGSMELRLTALLLVVSVPVLVAVTTLVSLQARAALLQEARSSLANQNDALRSSINFWLDFNVRALQEMASRPEIYEMDPAAQKPVLERFARTYPHMYLVSVTDLQGMNTARSDGGEQTNYSDRAWFSAAGSGEAVTYQTLIGRTSGQPALVVSTPVRSSAGTIVGVAMFAADLDVLASQVQLIQAGERGQAYILDRSNQVLAHPDRQFSAELKDLTSYPAVKQARAGTLGQLEFTDPQGENWQAYVSELPEEWLVVVQVPTAQLLNPVNRFQTTALTGIGLGAILLLFLASLTVSQAIRPIRQLTKSALVISEGDLTYTADVESQDEIGVLAGAFNKMTAQLRSLISDLENRVDERTQALEKRALQLQVTAEVARETLAITDLEGLLTHATRLISRRFSFYHTGIFLVDEAREYAHLRAASSEGGQRMLARRHRLKVGQEGIVGAAAATGKPRIALDVGADAVFFNNPDLPQTRSEVALPLKVRDATIGVLDVQSTTGWAFSAEDMDILQILADQIALGIENARLLASSQQALRDLEALYTTQTRQAWEQQLDNQAVTYRYSTAGVVRAEPVQIQPAVDDPYILVVPISLREQEVGRLMLRRETAAGEWLEEEKILVERTISQVALALENARLLDEVQRNAYEEQVVGEIATTAQSSLNLETVMKATVEELGRVLKVARVQIRLADQGLATQTQDDQPGGSLARSGNGSHTKTQVE